MSVSSFLLLCKVRGYVFHKNDWYQKPHVQKAKNRNLTFKRLKTRSWMSHTKMNIVKRMNKSSFGVSMNVLTVSFLSCQTSSVTICLSFFAGCYLKSHLHVLLLSHCIPRSIFAEILIPVISQHQSW